jgi:hypothetical protein
VHRAAAARGESRALDDDTLGHFVRDGYVTVQTNLPPAFHADLRQRAGAILDREGNWGNNILPRLPVLHHVLDDPAVAGALASLLGPTYVLHPHRYCHRNEPGSVAQRLHKDTRDFSGDHHLRHHRPRWVIAFYYPQDVSSDMGPTAIVPRSQYYLEQPDRAHWPEAVLCPPTGTVALITSACGTAAGAAPAVHRLAAVLADDQPYVRMNAATALARIGPAAAEAVHDLVRALDDDDRYASAWAAIALRRIGTPEATSAVLDHLLTTRWCATTTTENRY